MPALETPGARAIGREGINERAGVSRPFLVLPAASD